MTLLYDALEVYLGPLLKKHDAGLNIVWEDLEASQAASSKFMESNNNDFVSVRCGRI